MPGPRVLSPRGVVLPRLRDTTFLSVVFFGAVVSAVAAGPANPSVADLRRDEEIPDIIERALDASVRVDTTLRELFPELTRAAFKAVP